jgi:5-methylcytosine-specific restriction endonuclease McrA
MAKRGRPSFGAILKAANAKCAECPSQEELQIHHKVPLAMGGTNEADNLEILCKQCHLKRHGMDKSKKQLR